MDDFWKAILLMVALTFLLTWGCTSCINSLNDEYPDWKKIEAENEARRNYIPPPLSEAEQKEKDRKDSIWEAERRKRSETFFMMMQAAGEAEEQWKKEHEGKEYHDVMSTYDEGYEEGFNDRMNGISPNENEYGTSYDAGYYDGYGY